MEPPLASAEAYQRVTEGILARLSSLFPEWEVDISFRTWPSLKQLPTGDGIVRVTPVGWKQVKAESSRVGAGVELFYAIYVGLPLSGMDWTQILPASQAPFRIYDALKHYSFPECPCVCLSEVTDEVFVDFDEIGAEQVFHSVLSVSFLAGNLGQPTGA